MPGAATQAEPGQPGGEFELTQKDFLRIAKILYEDSGISLPDTKAALVYSRLAKRLRALGLQSFREYCEHVTSSEGAGERMTMLAALTTNVTHFFREMHHFDTLRTVVLPPLLEEAKRGGRVRIWSAGCSNGHEPYSIALTVLGLMPEAANYDIRILASDIDPNVVAFGRAGIYDDAAVQPVPTEIRRRWFSRGPQGHSVSDEMRALVAFRELNLIGEWPMKNGFHAIFCRNVTIYFDEPTRQKVWKRFLQYVEPGGVLFIGHSERLTGPAADHMALAGTTTYRRL